MLTVNLNADRLLMDVVLGEGAFGVVLKAEAHGITGDKNARTIVAVKTIRGSPFKCILLCGFSLLARPA